MIERTCILVTFESKYPLWRWLIIQCIIHISYLHGTSWNKFTALHLRYAREAVLPVVGDCQGNDSVAW